MSIERRLSNLERRIQKSPESLPCCPVCLSPRNLLMNLNFWESVEYFRRSRLPRTAWPVGILDGDERQRAGKAPWAPTTYPMLDRFERLEKAMRKRSDDILRRAAWKCCPGCGETNYAVMTPDEILVLVESWGVPREEWPKELADHARAKELSTDHDATETARVEPGESLG